MKSNVMYKQRREAWMAVKFIEPALVTQLRKEDMVVVNRVRLNAKNVEFAKKRRTGESVIVLQRALRSMNTYGKKRYKIAFGAKMRVGDVIKIFDDISSLPKNTFAVAD